MRGGGGGFDFRDENLCGLRKGSMDFAEGL